MFWLGEHTEYSKINYYCYKIKMRYVFLQRPIDIHIHMDICFEMSHLNANQARHNNLAL